MEEDLNGPSNPYIRQAWLQRFAWGNRAMLLAWVLMGVGGVAFLLGDLLGIFNVLLGIILPLAFFAASSWIAGLFLIGGKLPDAMVGPILLRLMGPVAGAAQLFCLLWLFAAFVLPHPRGLGTHWILPANALVSLLIPLCALYLGIVGSKAGGRLAWLFFVWIPISLGATVACLTWHMPHWFFLLSVVHGGDIWLGWGILAGIVLPIMAAHLSLHVALARRIRALKVELKD
jgi:hypothetical protein